MNETLAIPAPTQSRSASPGFRLYAAALVVALAYLVMANELTNNKTMDVTLPVGGASVLLVTLIAAESVLFIRRLHRQQQELVAANAREIETAQQRVAQRQSMVNEISRVLIDKLDVSQLPPSVFESIAKLFEADVVVTWVVERDRSQQFTVRGVHGLQEHNPADVASVPWSFPAYEGTTRSHPQSILSDFSQGLSPSMKTFCEREKIELAVFSPVMHGDELAGLLGVFYRKAAPVAPTLAAEMQTIANLIASAIQAEELYRDLVQAQKIDSLGTLASGIAHDMNNVLAAILACATYVKQQADPGSPVYRYLEATESSAHRGAALTKQLLSFVRNEAPQLTVIKPNECVEQTLKMLERSFDKSILLHRQLAANVKPIEIDPTQLEQVILNMAVNARDAMTDGGFFTVSTRNAILSREDPYRPKIELPDGEYVVFGFRDTGCGMDAATMKRIFEPFFTTKRPGKGTGLGLSTVLSIVRNACGEIRVESKLKMGTLFEVYLPVTAKPLPAKFSETGGEARGGRECILLAEDEEIIREMAQLGLEALGYRVITAADGAAALARYREQWQNIDLVIVDMAMPRMSGSEVFAKMKEINPGVRVIVSSGYSHDQEGQRMLQHGCLGFLQKPYNVTQLCQHVRSVLDSGI